LITLSLDPGYVERRLVSRRHLASESDDDIAATIVDADKEINDAANKESIYGIMYVIVAMVIVPVAPLHRSVSQKQYVAVKFSPFVQERHPMDELRPDSDPGW
jgi:hypothetical protein